jgi:hypothetical protein
MTLPVSVTLALVESDELPAAFAWAQAAGVDLSWDRETLQLRAVFRQRATNDKFYLQGTIDGYKALPPVWNFFDSTWQRTGRKFFPAAATLPGGMSSIFLTNPVICAPFNRLAFQQHGGPHADWGGPEQWLRAGAGYVHADTLADMLAVIARDINYSNGRMAA